MKRVFLVIAFLLISCTQQQVKTDGSLQINTKELPNWLSGGTATFKILVTGGTPPYAFSLSGNLPNGFNLGPDGTIGGGGSLPAGTSKKTFPPFILVVTDSKGDKAEKSFAVTIIGPSISIHTQLATCIVKQKCDELIATAEKGNPPYSFQSDSFAEGAPPMGMIVDVNGHILGTASKEGDYSVGVCVKDTNGNSKCGHAQVKVQAGAAVEGDWNGPYGGIEISGPCTTSNDGMFTFSLTETEESFSGSLIDEGNSVSRTEQCSGGSYRLSGKISGTISGNTLNGIMTESGSGMSYKSPFTATLDGDTMVGSYSGTGKFSDGGSSEVSGNFNLKKQS
ncbi:MAG: hypothetical protein AABW88_03885 [Nanoarchaeota archaeon]